MLLHIYLVSFPHPLPLSQDSSFASAEVTTWKHSFRTFPWRAAGPIHSEHAFPLWTPWKNWMCLGSPFLQASPKKAGCGSLPKVVGKSEFCSLLQNFIKEVMLPAFLVLFAESQASLKGSCCCLRSCRQCSPSTKSEDYLIWGGVCCAPPSPGTSTSQPLKELPSPTSPSSSFLFSSLAFPLKGSQVDNDVKDLALKSPWRADWGCPISVWVHRRQLQKVSDGPHAWHAEGPVHLQLKVLKWTVTGKALAWQSEFAILTQMDQGSDPAESSLPRLLGFFRARMFSSYFLQEKSHQNGNKQRGEMLF